MITLCEVFRRRNIFSQEEHQLTVELGEAIDRKLNGLMNSLRGKNRLEVLGQRLENKR
jgi:hypothetical protein